MITVIHVITMLLLIMDNANEIPMLLMIMVNVSVIRDILEQRLPKFDLSVRMSDKNVLERLT